MSKSMANFVEQLVPVSDFSQGKAGKIFNDVAVNNREYIVLKNNQPTAVVMSIKEYKATQEKIARLEKILEIMENIHLLKQAETRDNSKTSSLKKFIEEEGYCIEELEKLVDEVEIE